MPDGEEENLDYVPLSVDFQAVQKDSDGLEQPLRFSCEGQFYRTDEAAVLLYRDPGDFGFSTTLNRVELYPDGGVKLVRTGEINMTLQLLEGEKSVTTLGVEGGQMTISLYAATVRHRVKDAAGSIDLTYVLDYGNSYTIENKLRIDFKPAKNIDLPDIFEK